MRIKPASSTGHCLSQFPVSVAHTTLEEERKTDFGYQTKFLQNINNTSRDHYPLAGRRGNGTSKIFAVKTREKNHFCLRKPSAGSTLVSGYTGQGITGRGLASGKSDISLVFTANILEVPLPLLPASGQ